VVIGREQRTGRRQLRQGADARQHEEHDSIPILRRGAAWGRPAASAGVERLRFQSAIKRRAATPASFSANTAP
jgi:hypothetical protein